MALAGTLVATLGLAACSKDPEPAPATPTVTVDATVEPSKTDAPKAEKKEPVTAAAAS